MPHYLPYLVLVFFSVALLVAIMLHQRSPGVIFLFMTLAGIVYVAEFFVLILFDGYAYFPGVLSICYYDNALGAIVSNLVVLPVLALLVSLYHLRLGGIVALAAAMVGVERLFYRLSIFEPHWWNLSYTAVVLISFFYLARYWVRKTYAGRGFYLLMSLWLLVLSSVGTVMYVLSVLGIRHYHIGVFENMFRDDLFFTAILSVLRSGVFSAFVVCCAKIRWRLLAPLLVFALDMSLYAAEWLKILIPFWQYALIYMFLAVLVVVWSSLAHRYLWSLPVKMHHDVDTTPRGAL